MASEQAPYVSFRRETLNGYHRRHITPTFMADRESTALHLKPRKQPEPKIRKPNLGIQAVRQ
ncbi:MAG: hypothetical protein DMF90_14505 [Acidobacteria bacterium]|nr:MAG: hypothetical protein DMF90_14505 [Acidobacteriota bacterium]